MLFEITTSKGALSRAPLLISTGLLSTSEFTRIRLQHLNPFLTFQPPPIKLSPRVKWVVVKDSLNSVLKYHMAELEIAKDASRKGHLLPEIPKDARFVLDIGCGMGQTLIACNLPGEVYGYGIDCDSEAILAGKKIVPSNIDLRVASGEAIPFPNDYFDFIIARVSLPYMNINQAVHEISRVLKIGGRAWLVLHAHTTLKRRILRSARAFDGKDVIYCLYILINTLLVFRFDRQINWKQNRTETFQTISGMLRKFEKVGMVARNSSKTNFFIIEAEK
jgi:SAM-dependent methyltransferase